MKTIINQSEFVKAVEYISKNHFSKPYSITPVVDRWFNQLAKIQLEDGQIISLSGKTAIDHLEIIVDGNVVPKKDIQIVRAFYSKSSNADEELDKLISAVEDIQESLDSEEDRSSEETAKLHTDLQEAKAKVNAFNANKKKADVLYKAIVERGQTKLNEESLETAFGSKIKNIVYRPNHGLAHSVRAAYSVTEIQQFRKDNALELTLLTDSELHKSQLMMLFSVVGRKDETGFNDTGANNFGRATYESFRSTSGKEYLKYCKDQGVLYENLDDLYRDAIIVELMGYSTIKDCISRRKQPPELFIDYVVEKEKILGSNVSREDAVGLIASERYTLDKLYPLGNIRNLADNKLAMMNDAHGLDLTRCYSLYPTKVGGAKSISVLNYHLQQTGFFTFNETPNEKKLSSAFRLLRSSFDAMSITGDSTTFGLPSIEEYEKSKDALLANIKAMAEDFENPAKRVELLAEASQAQEDAKTAKNGEFFTSSSEIHLLRDYRNYKILKTIANNFDKSPKLQTHARMFDYQHSTPGKPHEIDHHQNAVRLVNSMQKLTPLPGVEVTKLPEIAAVTHHKKDAQFTGRVTLYFDKESDATSFQQTYQSSFEVKPAIAAADKDKFSTEVDRKQYKQLVADRLISFKMVKPVAEVSREENLVSADGEIEALALIKYNKALVRLVSTTALGGETFPDYEYLFRALDDPAHERYAPPLKHEESFPLVHNQYYDPRNGVLYTRQIAKEDVPELRFQEPVTEPISFKDKVEEGWVVGKSSAPKNTIYTKKLAHSLLPPHGQMPPFAGYFHKRVNYFPIGVLSDVDSVDLKEGRYIWADNMGTAGRFWLRDPRVYNKKMYEAFNCKLDNKDQPLRHATKVAVLDKSRLHNPKSQEVLVKYLEKRAHSLHAQISETRYRPTTEAITDFKMLIQQERKEYLDQLKGNKEAQKKVNYIYKVIHSFLDKEAQRKTPKYSISFKDLVKREGSRKYAIHTLNEFPENLNSYKKSYIVVGKELFYVNSELKKEKVTINDFDKFQKDFNKKNTHKLETYALTSVNVERIITSNGGHKPEKLGGNNEILAGATKGAVRALYASKDTLFERLNLAFHYQQIRERHHYDIPLVILSQDKEPYFYTEAIMKKDLKDALSLLRTHKFPYEKKAEHKVYEVNPDGSKGPVKVNERGREVHAPKNMAYQKQLLVDLFKVGLPQLKTIGQLEQGRIGKYLLNAQRVTEAVEKIADTLDFIGSKKRETKRMETAFSAPDPVKQENFFLRAVVLGHEDMVKSILEKPDFKVSLQLLDQAEKFAQKHNHPKIKDLMVAHNQEITQAKETVKTNAILLQNPLDVALGNANVFQRWALLDTTLGRFNQLEKKYPSVAKEIKNELEKAELSVLLNSASSDKKGNHNVISQLRDVLNKDPLFAQLYSEILVANKEVKVDELLDAQARLGNEAIYKAMPLIIKEGWEVANNYLVLVEVSDKKTAEAYLESRDVASADKLAIMQQKCLDLVKNIQKEALGNKDDHTHDFCEGMAQAIELGKDNYIALAMHFQKLSKVYDAVTSPEMQAVKKVVRDMEGSRFGNFLNHKSKANSIKEALCAVPLMDRMHVFSNEANAKCNEVRKALAQHRLSNKNPLHNNKVNPINAANSFTTMPELIKQCNDKKKPIRAETGLDNPEPDNIPIQRK